MNIRVLLDLGAAKVLINEIASEAPNPVQELMCRLVIVVKQHLYRVLAVNRLEVWKCQCCCAGQGGPYSPTSVESLPTFPDLTRAFPCRARCQGPNSRGKR